ncbi:hypothetical protein NL676_002495 [Syzygium grande]|nr:hypothetical protein NL676_002495 [Syzygium grande]
MGTLDINLRADRVKALVNTSVTWFPRNPERKPVETTRARGMFGDDYYLCWFLEPGVAEEDFARADTAKLMKKLFLTSRDPSPFIVPKDVGFSGLTK